LPFSRAGANGPIDLAGPIRLASIRKKSAIQVFPPSFETVAVHEKLSGLML
jgi:hypothetical protein